MSENIMCTQECPTCHGHYDSNRLSGCPHCINKLLQSQECKYKVGDRVRVLKIEDSGKKQCLKIGNIYLIEKIYPIRCMSYQGGRKCACNKNPCFTGGFSIWINDCATCGVELGSVTEDSFSKGMNSIVNMLKEKQKNKFNVGDEVVFCNKQNWFYGMKGIVVALGYYKSDCIYSYKVRLIQEKGGLKDVSTLETYEPDMELVSTELGGNMSEDFVRRSETKYKDSECSCYLHGFCTSLIAQNNCCLYPGGVLEKGREFRQQCLYNPFQIIQKNITKCMHLHFVNLGAGLRVCRDCGEPLGDSRVSDGIADKMQVSKNIPDLSFRSDHAMDLSKTAAAYIRAKEEGTKINKGGKRLCSMVWK